MKLLPTGRKSVFYITIYGSVLGAGSFLLHYFSMLVNYVLVNFGLSEDMYNPDGKTLYNELEVVEGMKLDRSYTSPYFITNQKTQKCELEDPLILIHEKKISSINAVVKVLELALKKQRPLLIVAKDVESAALATLILNKLQAGIKVCTIKAPGFGENRKAGLQDLATLTGGEVITEELGMNLEKVEPDMLGPCKKDRLHVSLALADNV